MIRPIVTYDIRSKENPPILRKKLREVTDFSDPETIACIRDLNDSLDDLIRKEGNKRGAIGLSACQIGYDLAISTVTLGNERYNFVNPKLESENGKDRLFRIGCFSLYEYRAMVRYNDDVIISYFDENGEQKKLRLQGDRSCVVQHEMDHLQGDLLFERLEHKEEDLFIPKEALYKDGKIPMRNRGIFFEIRRRLGLNRTLSSPVYYSSLFNDYTDYVSYVEKEKKENGDLLDLISRYAPASSKILEADDSTSALAICLSRQGYEVSSFQSDKDMSDLNIRINEQNASSVTYKNGNFLDLPYPGKSFAVIFSLAVIETMNDSEVLSFLNEGLRVADRSIFKVPTLFAASNTLKGNERLRTENAWRKAILSSGHRIVETKKDKGYLTFVVE